MAKAGKSKSIIEVACGSGTHSDFIARNYLSKGARLVSCDFSKAFIETMRNEVYAQSIFPTLEACSVKVDLDTDYVANEKAMAVLPKPSDKERMVFGCMADNMRLPFEDQSFDCYISNLSMMIVPDYKLQIKECYRVLKPKSYACLTVWGRPENSINFTCIGKAMEACGKSDGFKIPGYFHISQNWAEVKQEFINAGFHKNIKSWYQP